MRNLKITLIASLFIVAIACASTIELFRSYDSFVQVAHTKADSASFLISEWIDESFVNIEYILKDSLSTIPESRINKVSTFNEKIEKENERLLRKKSLFENIIFLGIFDSECVIRYGSIKSIVGDSSKDLDREYCFEVFKEPVERLKLSNFFISSTGQMNVSATYPYLSNDGKVIAFALAALDLTFFQKWLDTITDPSLTVSIIDFDKILLARKPLTDGIGKEINDNLLAQFINGDSTKATTILKSPVDGIERVWSLRKISDLPFVVAVGYKLEYVLAPWRNKLFAYIISNIIIIIITISLAKSYHKNSVNAFRMENLAMYDQLTGLLNRRSFENLAKPKIERAAYSNQNWSLVLIDVDHFKSINDTYGHDIGDKVLQQISDTIKTSFRSSDLVCRWGGEEFIVYLHETDIESASMLAKRLQQKIKENEFINGTQITVSQGVASFFSGETYEDVIKKADKMLYKAKNCGRNCVCC